MAGFRLGASLDEQPFALGDLIEIAPAETVGPKLRRGWPVGRVVGINAQGLTVRHDATGKVEALTWSERGWAWRRAGS